MNNNKVSKLEKLNGGFSKNKNDLATKYIYRAKYVLINFYHYHYKILLI